ncbi:MAG: SRPBCC family protein [Nannocystales bacterium]
MTPRRETRPIIVEQTYDVPTEVVWQAITDGGEMSQWFFSTIETFEATVGFETRFTVEADGVDYVHLWRVEGVVPLRALRYRWRYEGLPGDSEVLWELSSTAEGAHLKLTHTIFESFPADDPAFTRAAGVDGWTFFLRERLCGFLSTSRLGDPKPGA